MSLKPEGIIVPIVTPFTQAGKVDEKGLRKVIDFLIANGSHGIFPLGTTGEFYAIEEDDYRRIVDVTLEHVAGRVPVYLGCNHITTRGVIKQVKIAEKYDVAAISVLTPMFISQTQNEIYSFFKDIASETSKPVIMYNNLPKTNVTITPETALRLAEDVDNIIGVKDSTGDFTNTLEYIRLTRHMADFHVLVGRDTHIFAGLCSGATGAIASCANVAPRVVANIYDRFLKGDYAGALEAQFELAPLRIATGLATFPSVIKEGMEMQGISVGKCIDPVKEMGESEKEKLRTILLEMKLI